MMMAMGMRRGSHRAGEQEPIPEMAPGWKDSLCVAASAPWHQCPAPAQTLSTSSCHPTAVPISPHHSDTPGSPHAPTSQLLKRLPQPKGSQG